jgi:hypothetical protein
MPRHLATLICTAVLLLAGCTVTVPGTPAPAPGAAGLDAAAPDAAAPNAAGPAVAPSVDATPPAQPPAPRPSTGPGSFDPVVSGWKPVHSVQRAALYDVPPTWEVNSEDTIVGFGTRNGSVVVAASGSASVGKNACGQFSSLATSVVKHSTSSDLATASRLEAQQWAGAAFLDSQDKRPTLRTGAPETITTATGKSAVIVKVTATAASAIGPCGTKGVAYAVSATGFTGRLGPTAILIVVAGAGFPNAVPDDRIRQILTTLRPEA